MISVKILQKIIVFKLKKWEFKLFIYYFLGY